MKSIIIKYLIFAIVLTLVSFLIFGFIIPDKSCLPVYFVPAFFALISILFAILITKPKFNKIAKFSAVFMASNMIKLIIYFVYLILVFLNVNNSARVPFTIFFMATYLVFASYDTLFLLKFFGNKDKKTE
ncbi:MAG: hypothetical protein MJ211_07125 [Bacteroidales bacterium]|nr:hypothetical protein [Bacteroidales bacterium]